MQAAPVLRYANDNRHQDPSSSSRLPQIAHVPSPPPLTGSSRTEAQHWPTTPLPPPRCPSSTYLSTCLPIDKVGSMVYHSPRQGWHPGPTGENDSALDPQTLSRLPRPQYGAPACPSIRPICPSPFPCGQQLLRSFQRVGAVSYHPHPQPARSRISRT